MKNKFSTLWNRYFLNLLIASFYILGGHEVRAQLSYKVLFLGNSYTGVNNLPQLVHDVALSAGDTLIFDSNTPGGYRLVDHYNDQNSRTKIMSGGWDYVVMQGQSQEPVISTSQFTGGGMALRNLVKQYNSCAVPITYMTWGRKNGDASSCSSFPVMCTYEGMDTSLRNQYINLTASMNGEVAPVSVVWKYLRQNFPAIELYQSDESHPSPEGSYAAACCFYAAIFKKDPTLITFNSTINATDAAIIRDAARTQVFNNLAAWDLKKLPVSNFNYYVGSGSNEIIFNQVNQYPWQSYLWDFGDGDTSSAPIILHNYAANGTYIVTLTTTSCDLQGTHTSVSDTIIQFCNHTPTIYTSHPWLCQYDTLWTQPGDSYQWYSYGQQLPETNQYLSDYYQYNQGGGVSVLTTVNGCSEWSAAFTEMPQWSGYYFDAIGNPCNGDTVAFVALHINGFLNGQESILWFKNDTLLPFMTNEDTLYIMTSGKYECRISEPLSTCSLDTTSYAIEYDCNVAPITEGNQQIQWSVFPNPATETITIKFTKDPVQEIIQIYNISGRIIKEVIATAITTISIKDLANGLYFIRQKNNERTALKFVKQE